ncbi:type II toxin-antitoxin system VapC family toxin [Candidatus Curtissbacteria bacterium]|nr:type II toxin-antitoxin system VapC family toxin [Candidatus Curtissbacteria bacterium]
MPVVRYLLDSDVIIEYLKDNRETVTLINKTGGKGLSCSVLTIIEVKRGVRPKQEATSADLFKIIKAYPVDKQIAELAVAFAREWQGKGKFLQLVDACIAATCVIYDLTLVTYNKRDYPMKELRII